MSTARLPLRLGKFKTIGASNKDSILRRSQENIEIVPTEVVIQHKGPETMRMEKLTDERRASEIRLTVPGHDQKRLSVA